MSSDTLSFYTLQNRHIPEPAVDVVRNVSRGVIDVFSSGRDLRPRRMMVLEDRGVLKVFSEYENDFSEPGVRLKFFFTENASKVGIKSTYFHLDREEQSHAALSSRKVKNLDTEEIATLLCLGMWGPEYDDDDDETEDNDDDLFGTSDD